MKKLIIVLLFFALFFAGCTILPKNIDSSKELNALKEEYSAVEAFPSNTSKMNDYISELSMLVSKTGQTKGVLAAELYSAQAFYYLSKAMEASKQINYNQIICSSSAVKETKSLAQLAVEKAALAEKEISELNDSQLSEFAREPLAVQNYGETAQKIIDFFKEKC